MSTHKEPNPGIQVHDHGVTFCVWTPFANKVAIMGSFNDWSKTSHELDELPDGYWRTTVAGAVVGQEYKYIITNGDQILEKNDPRALQLTAANDACVITDPHFEWDDGDFSMPLPDHQVMYELHIGTFNRVDSATPGTFETAMNKLDYIANLGVNVIELMPVNATTVDRWWGYDPDYIFAVDAAYGGRQAFKQFVQAAHSRGIGVVLDVVFNHLSPFPGLDLWQFDGWNQDGKGGIYFYNDWRGDTPWGPRPDYGRPEVRQYIIDCATNWIKDCHVDGLRVDAVFQIRNAVGRNDDPSTDLPDGWLLLQEMNTAIKNVNPQAMMVAEDMALNDYITKPVNEGGAGFDAQWEASYPSTLRKALNPIADKDRDLNALVKGLTRKYNNQAFQRVVYSESHDADANGNARLNVEIAPQDPSGLPARRRSLIGAVIAVTSPGIPMLFQGQEFMEDGWFSHWKSLDWSKAKEFSGIVQAYTDLISLRLNKHGNTAGLQGQDIAILHNDSSHNVLAYHRSTSIGGDKGDHDDQGLVIAINLSHEAAIQYPFKFPTPGVWKTVFNSDWNGYSPDFTNIDTPDVTVIEKNGAVNIGAYSAVILVRDEQHKSLVRPNSYGAQIDR